MLSVVVDRTVSVGVRSSMSDRERHRKASVRPQAQVPTFAFPIDAFAGTIVDSRPSIASSMNFAAVGCGLRQKDTRGGEHEAAGACDRGRADSLVASR
jgi:hypothetical protein